MNENNKSKKEAQERLMSKLMELSGLVISMQKNSRYEKFFEEIIKYLKIIQKNIAVYFISTYFLLFISIYYEYLRKILFIIF
jgi:hypothetical protein